MSRRIAPLSVAAAAAIAALSLSGCAPQTNVTTAPEAAPHTVSVSATGQAEAVPDAAKASVTIEVTDPSSAQTAQQQAADAATKTIDSLKASGVAAEDIATQGLTVGPVYNYTQDGGQEMIGYRAAQTLTVTLRNLATAGATLDAAVAAGGNAVRVDSLAPFVTDPTKAQSAAREQAVSMATKQAQQYAQLLGFELGGVASVSEATTSAGPPPVAMADAAGAAEAKPATPIEAGTTTVSVTVDISWAIG
jgi:uncharacterized protein YggE